MLGVVILIVTVMTVLLSVIMFIVTVKPLLLIVILLSVFVQTYAPYYEKKYYFKLDFSITGISFRKIHRKIFIRNFVTIQPNPGFRAQCYKSFYYIN